MVDIPAMTGSHQSDEIGLVKAFLVPFLNWNCIFHRNGTSRRYTDFQIQSGPHCSWNISALARPFCRCLKWTEVAHPTM